MRDSMTARSNFAGSSAKPGASAKVSQTMATSARSVTTSRARARPAIASSPKRRAASASPRPMGLDVKRYEGRGERSFGKEPTEQVGQALGDEISLGDRAGPERRGDEHVADEAEDAARGGGAADGGEIPQERHAGTSVSGGFAAARRTGRRLGRMKLAVESSEKPSANRRLASRVGNLVADEVGHVEHVDGALAEGRDVGRGDVEIEVGNGAGEIVEKAGPVEARGLDDGELVRPRIVDEDARLEREGL